MAAETSDESKGAQIASTKHLFWARELIQLARTEAKKRGVPDHVMAQAMLVQAWMLFTGQNEGQAKNAVSGLFSASMARTAKPSIAENKPAGKPASIVEVQQQPKSKP